MFRKNKRPPPNFNKDIQGGRGIARLLGAELQKCRNKILKLQARIKQKNNKPMTVWLVFQKYPAIYVAGEHSCIVEVCSTKEWADRWIEAALAKDNTEYYEAEEWEVVGSD